MSVSVAHVSVPMYGQIANGDRPVSRDGGEGVALFGVVDGLGHGPDAAAAAQAAVDCLKAVSLEASLLDIMHEVHAKLSGSRGAAASICLVRAGEIEVCAVGNVEVRSSDVRIPLVYSPGILGARVQKWHVCRAPITRGRVVLFSDGLALRTSIDDAKNLAPQPACEALMQKYGRREDDATVLVADAG